MLLILLCVTFRILKYFDLQTSKSFRTDVADYRDYQVIFLLYSASCFLFTVNYSVCIAVMIAFPSKAVKYQYFIKIKQNRHPADFYTSVKSQALTFFFIFFARFVKQYLQNTKELLINTVFLCLLAVT